MIHFVTHEAHIAEQTNDIAAPWLKLPTPGLLSSEAEALADHLGDKLNWFTWYVEDDNA